jgi:hypothetical protein
MLMRPLRWRAEYPSGGSGMFGAPDAAAPARGAVCRTFGLKCTTLIDFLAWIGWSAGLRDTGKA